MSHGAEKSDCCVVPRKLANKAGPEMAGLRRRWREGGRRQGKSVYWQRVPDIEPGSREKRPQADTTGRILLA